MGVLHIDNSDSVEFQSALGKIQEGLGQTYGDVASHFFDKDQWTKKTYDERHDELLSYIKAELSDLAYNGNGELIESRKKIDSINELANDITHNGYPVDGRDKIDAIKNLISKPHYIPVMRANREVPRNFMGLFPGEDITVVLLVIDGMKYSVCMSDIKNSMSSGIIGDFIEPTSIDGEVIGNLYHFNVTDEDVRILNQEIANEN